MQTITLGTGEPELSIVACLHGNETAGAAIIDHVQHEEDTLQKPIQCIIANEKAMANDERYIDTDLNRAFPGDATSTKHEKQRAAQILDAVKDTTVIDLHTTPSTDKAFCVITGNSDTNKKLCQASGLDTVIDIGYESGGLIQHVDGISIECGRRGSDNAIKQGLTAVENILAVHGYRNNDPDQTDPICYEITGEIDRFKNATVEVDDFQHVQPGDTIATTEQIALTAQTSFYPVLTATNKYSERLGYTATRHGPLSAYKTLQDQGDNHA